MGDFDDLFDLNDLLNFHQLRHFNNLFYLNNLGNFYDFLHFDDLFHNFFHFDRLDDFGRGGGGNISAGGQVFYLCAQHFCQTDHLLGVRHSQTIFPFAHRLTGHFHCSCQLALGHIALLAQLNNAFTNRHKHLSHFYKISNCWLRFLFYTSYSEKSSFDRGFASAASFSSVLSMWV